MARHGVWGAPERSGVPALRRMSCSNELKRSLWRRNSQLSSTTTAALLMAGQVCWKRILQLTGCCVDSSTASTSISTLHECSKTVCSGHLQAHAWHGLLYRRSVPAETERDPDDPVLALCCGIQGDHQMGQLLDVGIVLINEPWAAQQHIFTKCKAQQQQREAQPRTGSYIMVEWQARSSDGFGTYLASLPSIAYRSMSHCS